MPVSDTERTAVRTYVPQYQKEEWADHADSLDMSQSEFVRTMVQAGRKELGLASNEGTSEDSNRAQPDDSGSSDMRDAIIEALEEGEPLDWDDLVNCVVGDIEGEIEAVLERLEDEKMVRYRPRKQGYVLTHERD